MRRAILETSVRLDLDDPAHPPAEAGILPHEVRTEKRVRSLERPSGEERAFERAQMTAVTADGRSPPKTV